MEETLCMFGGAQDFHKSRKKLKILGTTGMSSSSFFINGAQMSCVSRHGNEPPRICTPLYIAYFIFHLMRDKI
jgi:hypothetical protein